MKKYIHFILILIIASSAIAQTPLRMEFNAMQNNTPFRVNYGDSLVYQVILINNDTVAVGGNLYIGYFGSNSGSPDSTFAGSIQIGPKDTAFTSIAIGVTPQTFKIGPEVVVVWPIFNGNNGAQLADFIFVNNTLSSVEDYKDDARKITFNGTTVYSENLPLKRVRILSLSGQTILEFKPEFAKFEIPALPRAMYLLQCVTENNKTFSVKFISTN